MDKTETDLTGLGELHSLLGAEARFEGKLAFEGRVRIDGHLKGEIRSEGLLILSESATVEGDIHVGSVIVRGATIRGNIYAEECVEIHAPAKIYGNIAAPQLMIDKGVIFEGECSMAKPQALDLRIVAN